jgi:hypothetical protein
VVGQTVAPSAAGQVAGILDSPEVAALCGELDALRWTGRKGYGARVLVGACLVKSLYAIPTWTRTAALIAEHRALADAIGGAPSQWACYRFTVKLREQKPLLDACLSRVLSSLHEVEPHLGENLAIDASDLPAYANGQRFLSKHGPEREWFSDPHASWGHRSAVSTRRGGGFFGYRVHAAVDVATGLPLACRIESARVHESTTVAPLLDLLAERGLHPLTCAMDKGYDNTRIYAECAERHVTPIIPLRRTPDVERGEHLPPTCEHGTWTFAGADFKRKASKWRCPSGECKPASAWVKASRRHPLIPRHSKRFGDLYRGPPLSSASSGG